MPALDVEGMTMLKRLFPELGKQLKKGDCGKIGVIGGSAEYTGAPYFASITPMKIGSDLSFVYCHPAAAPAIKSYSPELIVYPSIDFATNKNSIQKLDALVFGPGLGREKETLNLLKDVLSFVKDSPKLCLVIDADGLFYLKECLDMLRECTNNLIITPNHREFSRLFHHIFPDHKPNSDDLATQRNQTEQLAQKLGVSIVRKGEVDIITSGRHTRTVRVDTCPRRCGGQGDILSGAIALFSFWSKRRAGADNYLSEHLLEGAEAASVFQRMASFGTYRSIGRSMNAADIIAHIPAVVRFIDNSR